MIKNIRHLKSNGTYTRREMALLFASFLVFLSGVPGRSEDFIVSLRHMVHEGVTLILVFLGLVTPAPQMPVVAQPRFMKIAPAPIIKHKPLPNSMMLGSDPRVHHYTYKFEGKATFKGVPCPNASVLVRISSNGTTVA